MNRTDFVKFQTQVTTGGLTLPVALVVWVLFAVAALGGWDMVNRLAASIVTGYLLIELNTAYSLIRQRTTLHITVFLLLAAASFALPLRAAEVWLAPLFLGTIHQLFATYESPRAPGAAFNAFFCLGLGSYFFPPMAWLVPVVWIGLYQMRALTLRTFCGSLIGFLTPWWCYYGYAYGVHGTWPDTARIEALITWTPWRYTLLPHNEALLWGALLLASVVSDVHYALVSYMDKVRTRVHLSYLIFVQVVLYAMAVLQPAYSPALWTLQATLVALALSHLFMLTRTRVISYYFLVFFLLFLLLPALSVWIV